MASPARGDDRAARAGARQQRRYGHRRQVVSGQLQSNPILNCSITMSMPSLASGYGDDGGHQRRGRTSHSEPSQKQSNLCWFYDNNHITIEGNTSLAFSEDVGKRFERLRLERAACRRRRRPAQRLRRQSRRSRKRRAGRRSSSSPATSATAYRVNKIRLPLTAKAARRGSGSRKPRNSSTGRRTLIFSCRTASTNISNRASASADEELRDASVAGFTHYLKKYPDQGQQLIQIMYRRLPDGWDKNIPTFPADAKGKATRDSSNEVQNAFAKNIPWLIGGSADLAPSTKTLIKGAAGFEADSYGGRNFHFSVRERDGGGPERLVGVAHPALRGDVLYLQRLHEEPDTPGGGDGSARDLRVHARLHRPRRAGPKRISPSNNSRACEPFRTSCCCVPPTRTKSPRRGALSSNRRIIPRRLVLTRQALPAVDRTKYAAASGDCAGRVHPGRCSGQQWTFYPDGHRQRDFSDASGL